MIFHSGLPPSERAGETCASAILLSRLADAHLKMEFCLADLEFLVAGANPGSALIDPARLRIRQAHFERRRVIREISEHLVARVSEQQADAVRQFQTDEMDRLRTASNHLRHWTSRRVRKDWAGYRSALRALTGKVRDDIAREKMLLVPLLAAS